MDLPLTEALTVGSARIVFERDQPPINSTLVSGIEPLQKVDVFDDRLRPDNQDQADGAPLRLVHNENVKLDLSKRRETDMGFWHRSADATEIIFCVRGALGWETEIGNVTLNQGEFIVIPRGVAHRSRLVPESGDDNVLLEIKVTGDLEPTDVLRSVLGQGG